MTLLEWKDRNKLTFPRIVELLGCRRSETWIKMVWHARGQPGTSMLMAIKKLTGLEDEEILGESK